MQDSFSLGTSLSSGDSTEDMVSVNEGLVSPSPQVSLLVSTAPDNVVRRMIGVSCRVCVWCLWASGTWFPTEVYCRNVSKCTFDWGQMSCSAWEQNVFLVTVLCSWCLWASETWFPTAVLLSLRRTSLIPPTVP